MYAWIWRKLPFGLPGKLIGSTLLAGLALMLLWFVVFPWAEPLLPFDDVQVTEGDFTDGDPGGGPVDGGGGDPGSGDPDGGDLDDFELPYDTETNNPVPPDVTDD
ncbi:hypothetical protein [Micromonospora sp. NBC_01813]|uniref:hypothetical protein n=1 Tax=Micromonospora sp. NBC_01813 TaxID=2975988 RepID=UPI002DD95845|nr:hypothetical protein [Micromonospora sp. NBC_01813]WSA07452.1 hypothetical protein OG958_24835 [Micromonospora sp. NBC_01813]